MTNDQEILPFQGLLADDGLCGPFTRMATQKYHTPCPICQERHLRAHVSLHDRHSNEILSATKSPQSLFHALSTQRYQVTRASGKCGLHSEEIRQNRGQLLSLFPSILLFLKPLTHIPCFLLPGLKHRRQMPPQPQPHPLPPQYTPPSENHQPPTLHS